MNPVPTAAPALMTDLYQLTMAYGYWKLDRHGRKASFALHYRKNPFGGGYAVAAGLAQAVEYLLGARFSPRDLAYLEGLAGNDGRPIFERAFLDYLSEMRFECDVDAVPEGTVVFGQEPLLRITGPILQGQILETPLLNLINFQTLIATKSARIRQAAQGQEVVEFGLRRAQGFDGALSASRAAYLGGAHATSNLQAGLVYGIPVRGTHAHSWVMSFDDEEDAFEQYAKAMPNNCVFLVDTYNTLEGVEKACRTGQRLRQRGHEMIGIRLDSGDLAWLSIEARRILDQNGFASAKILASNDLDEHIITSLKEQGAKIDVWGVGTRLVTAYDQPALGGIYKLTAIQSEDGRWLHKVKLSEQAVKVSTPGMLQVRRFIHRGEAAGDMIYDEFSPPGPRATMIDPLDLSRRKEMPEDGAWEDLLRPVFRAGRLVGPLPTLEQGRTRCAEQLGLFHAGIKRFMNPHAYPVGLEKGLFDLKTRLVLEARGIER